MASYRPVKLTMSIGSGAGGWNETYLLDANLLTLQAAIPVAKNLCWGRAAFFANNVFLDYARVSQVGPARDKRTIEFPYPMGQHPTWSGGTGAGDTAGPTNDPRVCIQMSMESVTGEWGNRYFRGINDNWVTASALVSGIMPYLQPNGTVGVDPDLSPTGGIGSHLGVCQGFWRLLMNHCGIMHKNSSISYDAFTIVATVFRNITSKKVGKRFFSSRGRRPTTLIS